jgi:hypothetical protein
MWPGGESVHAVLEYVDKDARQQLMHICCYDPAGNAERRCQALNRRYDERR